MWEMSVAMEDSKKTWKIDGYVWLHCPVCGHEVMDFDICDVCGWQNTGINNVDGGPNHMTLEEAKKLMLMGVRLTNKSRRCKQ